MPHQTFVEQIISAWQLLEAESPDPRITSSVKRLPDGSKSAIEIHAPSQLAVVEVWEHANCLDTTILREGEQSGVTLSAGPCANRAEGIERLRFLRATLTGNSSA
jgi:hypothetical protein